MNLKMNINELSIHYGIDVFEIMQKVLKREKKLNQGKEKEFFWVIALSHARRILNIELISAGNLRNVTATPSDILSIPLQKQAAGIILVHNHPSAIAMPSEEDKDFTNHLIQACRIVKTPILDHVIITEASFYSFKEHGLLERLEADTKYVPLFELEEQFKRDMQAEIRMVEEESNKKIQENLRIGEGIGIEKGIERGIERVVKQMLEGGASKEQIAKWSGLKMEEIEKLQQGKGK